MFAVVLNFDNPALPVCLPKRWILNAIAYDGSLQIGVLASQNCVRNDPLNVERKVWQLQFPLIFISSF